MLLVVGVIAVHSAVTYGFDGTWYFGSDGPNAYEAPFLEDDGALVWTMQSERDRFTGTFDDERNVITGHWDALNADSSWQPWMDITLTRQPG